MKHKLTIGEIADQKALRIITHGAGKFRINKSMGYLAIDRDGWTVLDVERTGRSEVCIKAVVQLLNKAVKEAGK